MLLAIPLGLVISFGSMSRFTPLRCLTRVFVWVIRGTPLMLQLMVVLYAPGLLFGIPMSNRVLAAVIAFVINYAAYFSEIYRGGIESIPRGQYEAGQVLGMTKPQIFFKVVLMQVVKRIVTPMGNEVITLVKDTSLAQVLTIGEMFTIAKRITASQSSLVPLFVAGIFYYVFNYLVAFVMERIEKKLSYYR